MAYAIKENSTNQINRRALSDRCGVNDTLGLLGKRWLMTILYEISLGNNRFSALRKRVPEISENLLGARIADLAGQGLIVKTVVENTMPSQVVYSTTTKGDRLLQLVDALCTWNREWERPDVRLTDNHLSIKRPNS